MRALPRLISISTFGPGTFLNVPIAVVVTPEAVEALESAPAAKRPPTASAAASRSANNFKLPAIKLSAANRAQIFACAAASSLRTLSKGTIFPDRVSLEFDDIEPEVVRTQACRRRLLPVRKRAYERK